MITGSLIGAGAGLASNLITNIFNYSQNKKNNEIQMQMHNDNMAWSKEQYFDQRNYQRELQQTLFSREDNAHQRQVADLKAAGLSPLANAGGAGAGQAVSSPSIPQFSTADTSPFVANEMQFGQLIDTLQNADAMALEREKLEVQKQKNLSDRELKEVDQKMNADQFAQSIQMQNAQLDQKIKEFNSNEELKKDELKLQEYKALSDVRLATDRLTYDMSINESKMYLQEMQQALGLNRGGRYKVFDTQEEYDNAMASYQKKLNEVLQFVADDLSNTTTTSTSDGSSVDGHANAGIGGDTKQGSGKGSLLSKALGVNANVNVNGSKSSHSSSTTTNDATSLGYERLRAFYLENELPILAFSAR